MDYASTHVGVSHRQTKAFKQRLAYWLKKGLPTDEAMRRSGLKELINQPISATQDENLLGRKPARTKTCSDENLLGRKPAAKLEPLKNLTYEIPLDLAEEVLAEGNGRGNSRGVLLNFPSAVQIKSSQNQSLGRLEAPALKMPVPAENLPAALAAFPSGSPRVSMSFRQPLSWVNGPQNSQPLSQPSPWLDFGRKIFWLLFATACLAFLVWGNFIRMEGPLPERLFKASFGEILVFGAGLMSFKSMLDQAQKVLVSLAGIGISLFLTQATISAAHVDASAKRLLAQQTLLSETVARDSLAKNLSEIAPDRINRAEEIREKLAAANERLRLAQANLDSIPGSDAASHSADLLIRLLAQLSIVLAVSQLRRPQGEAAMSRVF